MFARMANGIIDVLNRLIEQANKVPGVAINTIDKLNLKLEEETENAKQRGKDVVSNLASGMKSTLYKVRSVLGESVNALVKAMELMKK